MPNPSAAQFAFVPVDDLGRPKAGGRSVVRSHCMQGKNRREDSRRSMRKARQAEKLAAVDKMAESFPGAQSQQGAVAVHLDKPKQPPPSIIGSPGYFEISPLFLPSHLVVQDLTGKPTRSDEILANIYEYDSIMSFMYPLDRHINFLDYENQHSYVEWLLVDDGAYHAILLGISAARDYALGHATSHKTYAMLRRTTQLLNSRLNDRQATMVNSTIYIIMTLTFMAGMLGDYGAISAHMMGLHQIVRLRGGVQRLRLCTRLHFKIERMDLVSSLTTGRKPTFSHVPAMWDAIFEGSFIPDSPTVIPSDDMLQDRRLLAVCRDLQYMTFLINGTISTKTRLDGHLFQHPISSIQARLLYLEESLDDIVGEGLRLGMLAFLSTLFRLPSQRPPYKYLIERLRTICHAIEPSTEELREILFWLLMIGVVSSLDVEEPWVKDKWDTVVGPDPSWEGARKRLQAIMWIDFIHDEPGRRVFRHLTTRRSTLSLRN